MTSKSSKLAATVVSGHTFTVDTRYDLKDSKILGRGSYGVVTTATDKLQHGKIAIKRIRPFANDEWDARHTLREIRLLKLLGPHPNVRRCATITNMLSFYIRVTT
jgi:serine/threonine protein kinase